MPAVNLGPGFEALITWTSTLELNFVRFLPLNCVRPFSFYDELVVTTAFPILLAIAIACRGTIVARRAKTDKERRSARVRTTGWILFLMYAVLPSVSVCVMRYFSCGELRGNQRDIWTRAKS